MPQKYQYTKRHEYITGNLQTNKGAASPWGMPNYMPAFHRGEDSFPLKMTHVEELQRQYSLS